MLISDRREQPEFIDHDGKVRAAMIALHDAVIRCMRIHADGAHSGMQIAKFRHAHALLYRFDRRKFHSIVLSSVICRLTSAQTVSACWSRISATSNGCAFDVVTHIAPGCRWPKGNTVKMNPILDRKSTRLNSSHLG